MRRITAKIAGGKSHTLNYSKFLANFGEAKASL